MKTSSTATGSGSNVSGGVWLPKGTTLKGIMLIHSSVFNEKSFIAPDSLLFRHTLYMIPIHTIIITLKTKLLQFRLYSRTYMYMYSV